MSLADWVGKARIFKAAERLGALDNLLETGDMNSMVIESIREFKRAVPFKPFIVQTTNGKCFMVPFPEVIGILPKSSQVVVIDAEDHTHYLSPSMIKGVSLQKNRRATRTRADAIDNQGRTRQKSNMLIQSIRVLNKAVPFEPYEIQMVSGERYEVPHPDFISISSRGNYIVVMDSKNSSHNLSSLLIERVSPYKNRFKRKTAKGAGQESNQGEGG